MKLCTYKAIAALLLTTLVALSTHAQRNEQILNRPFADSKRFHYGFSVGMNVQNYAITNNGYQASSTEQWFAQVADYSPGFSVSILGDMRLGEHFNLRLSPGMSFGNKVIRYHNALAPAETEVPEMRQQRQNIKSTYITVPLDLKISALRYHNTRPYVTVGAMALYDLAKDHPDQLLMKNFDGMLTVGIGCDIYLPYFKLCPELKFCFGLTNVLDTKRPDLQDNPEMMKFTQSVNKVQNNMVMLTFNFE